MKLTIIGALVVCTILLSRKNLPQIKKSSFRYPELPRLPSRRKGIEFEQQIGFLYALKAQVLSGATNLQALEGALATVNVNFLAETRLAVIDGAEISAALSKDANLDKFSALTDLALIFDVSDRSGAPISNSVSRLIHNLVANRASKQLIAAEIASTKATIIVLASLPIVGLFLGTLLGAAPTGWLFHSPSGRLFLFAGLILEGLGLVWVHRITQRAILDNFRRRKARSELSSQSLVSILEHLSLCLAAGMNISRALTFIVPNSDPEVAEDLQHVISRHNLGTAMNVALLDLGNANPRWRSITDALVGALVSGGPLQNHLEDLLTSLRITSEMDNLKRIRSISIRAVAPLGLCFLPAFMLLSIVPIVVGLFSDSFL